MKNHTLSHTIKEFMDLYSSNLDKIIISELTIWSNTGWNYYESQYEDFIIYYYLDGCMEFSIAGKPYSIQPGDVFFADNYITSSCKEGLFSFFYISIKIEDSRGSNRQLYEKFKNLLRSMHYYVVHMKGRVIRNFFIEMLKEFLGRRPAGMLNIKSLLLQMLISIYREDLCISENSFLDSNRRQIVSEIITFISGNLDKSISLDELGERYNFSERYLNRIFKKAAGFPILQYQQHLKIEKAKKILSSTSINITEIAMSLNYSSSQHFSIRFKQMTGLTPTEYRKQLQDANYAEKLKKGLV